MDEDKLRYSDILQPDSSVEDLIKQLGKLNEVYGKAVGSIENGARSIVRSFKDVSGATSDGRRAIMSTSEAVAKLEQAWNTYLFAATNTGKMLSILRSETTKLNKATVEQYTNAQLAADSYNGLKAQLKEMKSLYATLNEAERRDSGMGGQLLNEITSLADRVKRLDDAMKPTIQTLTRLQKAQQELAYVTSNEGKKLMEVNAQIRDAKREFNEARNSVDAYTMAQERLANLQTINAVSLEGLNQKIRQQQELNKWTVQYNHSAEGSYNRLQAEYNLNKIKLNEMEGAMRTNTETGKTLEKRTLEIYMKMQQMNEATGRATMGMNHYTKTWDGLGFSIAQVIREAPNAAVSMRIFFLAISNNIPIVADEIKKARQQIKLAKQEGREFVPLGKQIAKSLISWHTALIVGITLLTLYGEQMVKFIKQMITGRAAVMSLAKAYRNVVEELKNTNDSYGSNMVALRKLQGEWGKLKTTAEKNQFIKDNEQEFRKWGVAVNEVTEAEELLVQNTDNVVEGFKLRAKAAAAAALAGKKFEEALAKEAAAEQRRNELYGNEELGIEASGPRTLDKILMSLLSGSNVVTATANMFGKPLTPTAEEYAQSRIDQLEKEANALEKEAEQYVEIMEKLYAKIGGLFDKYHKRDGLKDLTDIIIKNGITIQRKYEASVTELLKDDIAKRRKAAADQVQDENNKLREMYRKNVEYINNVDKKYKALTKKQKEQIAQQQSWIESTIANNLKALELQLQQLENEQKISSLRIQRNTVNPTDTREAAAAARSGESVVASQVAIVGNPDEMEKSLVRERDLMEKNLMAEFQLVMHTNAKLLEEGSEYTRSEEELIMEFNKRRLQLWNDYDKKILDLRKRNNEMLLQVVDPNSEQGLSLRLEQNEIERKAAHSANAAAAPEEQVASELIDRKFDKEAEKIQREHELNLLRIQREGIESRFELAQKGSWEELKLKLEQNRLEMEEALKHNEELEESERRSTEEIRAIYEKRAKLLLGEMDIVALEEQQQIDQLRFNLGKTEQEIKKFEDKQEQRLKKFQEKNPNATGKQTDRFNKKQQRRENKFYSGGPTDEETKRFSLQQERDRWTQLIALAESGSLEWSQAQIDAAKLTVKSIDKELSKMPKTKFEGWLQSVGQNGLLGGTLLFLGFDSQWVSAFTDMCDMIMDNIQEIIDLEVELREKAVEAAEARVEAAQSVYDAEVEGRNNGYANSVATAKKELQDEKKNLREKQKLLEEAQRQKELVDTAMQVSSLVTATANLWSSYSGIPVVGAILAAAATAAMWGSFAYAKIKARQVASAEYGEGGLEFLEGGSHASGNDIDLGTQNSKGRRMRAEGGEALAIINKKQTRKYRKVLPDVVESLNKGTFEDKYLNAFRGATELGLLVSQGPVTDLSLLEDEVRGIRRQGETRVYAMPDGTTVIQRRNVKRIIRN